MLRQLKKLREGAGLTNDRLEASGSLMSALASSSPAGARASLIRTLIDLGPTDQTKALTVDLGLDLEAHLGRPPTPGEMAWLGQRRSGYSQVIGRDVKTLARWSDRAAADLRTKLLNDTFTGHLWVMGAVRDDRIVGITMAMEDLGAETEEGRADDDWNPKLTHRRTVDYENPSDGPSLPCLLYGVPRDWRPATLTLAVKFLGDPAQFEAWGIHSPTFFEMSYAHRRHALQISDHRAICRFENPRTDRVYGLWWRLL